ncbi:hypothetical protein [Thiocapsa roseopersicina]|uniref:Uncharacterized protein n=1 Tax=Thiocapsa roseopersicina TaxID=1058 RepID=A0A1H2ZKQ3_THIRO|nr:hypothetical protein [Thiocapsa roseopersicina]SDX17937.1 hypothetical protein SAMN05421783_11639 [Thiocapsa roseopersicina]
MPRQQSFIDGERIRKARTLRRVEPIYEVLAQALATIPDLRFIKLFPGRLSASNQLSTDGKQSPVVAVGAAGIIGVELLIDTKTHVVQFYGMTSAQQGCGRKMVETVVAATPSDWFLAVPFDWSCGFWAHMADEYPRIQIF